MSLLLLLGIAAVWLTACAIAFALCVIAARADRATTARFRVAGATRHTARGSLRLHR